MTMGRESIPPADEGERLAHELVQLTAHISSYRLLKRLHFAVTPEEYRQIASYMLKRDGVATGYVRGIRLVISGDPRASEFSVSYEIPNDSMNGHSA
jgi:hypothetical protein